MAKKRGSAEIAFEPRNLAMDLIKESGKCEFDVEFRASPLWELDFIFPLRRHYAPFELRGEHLPTWIEIEILGQEGSLAPELKWVWKRFELHLVCNYVAGATKALRRRGWIKIRIKVDDADIREIECKLRQWRKR